MAKFGKKKWQDDQERMGSFEPIPKDDYLAKVVESEIKKTKNKDGQFARFVWEIAKGEYKGRKIFNNINFDNPNPEAVEMADKEIASMCDALGLKVSKFKDTKQAHGIICTLSIGVKEAEGNYDAQNVIKAYEVAKKSKGKGKKGKKPNW